MQIVENRPERLILRHGSAWLIPAFAVGAVGMGTLLFFSAVRLGWNSEMTWYAGLAFGVSAWGLLVSRVSRFDFDAATRSLRWSRRGLIPAGGVLGFDAIQNVVLESRSDRRDTRFHRVLLDLGNDAALPLVPGRTRDVYACLDVIEAIRNLLGKESMAPFLVQGDAAGAARFAENHYGVEPRQVQAWLERHTRREEEGDPACGVPS
ncbi:MAG: hypothetical protein OEW11_04570 [Nitrospirota bacterium]|nr:hypothetical protein [Nitrospirota bacterium]